MSKKVLIDQNKCIGCQTCVQIDPQVFVLNQVNFKVKIKKQEVTSKTKEAVDACPVNAISIKN